LGSDSEKWAGAVALQPEIPKSDRLLGHNGILMPEKIAHITAYLISPESSVNE
jgi:hypothetical protein